MPLVWALKIQNEANTFKTKCADPQLRPMPRRMSGPLLALREQFDALLRGVPQRTRGD